MSAAISTSTALLILMNAPLLLVALLFFHTARPSLLLPEGSLEPPSGHHTAGVRFEQHDRVWRHSLAVMKITAVMRRTARRGLSKNPLQIVQNLTVGSG